MRVKIKLAAVLCILSIGNLSAQPQFEVFASKYGVNDVGIENDNLWVATYGGVLQFDIDGSLLNIYHSTDGLIHNQITSVLIDSNGDKWFGTKHGGVSKLTQDGFESFKVFAGEDVEVYTIIEDSEGKIWFGTWSSGVWIYDGGAWNNLNTFNSGLIDNYVHSIAEDDNGVFWFGTQNGISKLENGSWQSYTFSNGDLPSGGQIESIGIDSEDNKWFGYFNGVSKFDGTEWTHYTLGDLGATSLRSLFVDSEDNLWIGSFTSGLTKYNSASTNSVTFSEVKGQVQQIIQNGDDILVTSGNPSLVGGLYRYDGANWQSYEIPNPFGAYRIWNIVQDLNENFWFATDGGGVTKFDGLTFTQFTAMNSGLGSDKVFALAINSLGEIFAGTQTGVSKYDGVNWSQIHSTSSVYALDLDSEDNIWIATELNGAGKFNGTSWATFNTGNSAIASNELRSLHVDANDDVWFGSWNSLGVSVYSVGSFTTFNESNSGLPNGVILSVTSDLEGNIWVSDIGHGVYKYDQTTWTKFGVPESYSKQIWSISSDPLGRIWFGATPTDIPTENKLGGVAVYDGVNFKSFNNQNSSIVSQQVYSVFIDQDLNAWIGTFYGAAKLAGDPFAKVDQTISFPPIGVKTLGDQAFTISASATSDLPVAFESVNAKTTIANNKVTLIAAGMATVRAKQEGNVDYNPANPVEQTFCVNPAKPTIDVTTSIASGLALQSSSETGNQWFFNGEPIAGATQSTYSIAEIGEYNVQVTIENCVSVKSETQSILITGDDFRAINSKFSIFPNPTQNTLRIHLGEFEMGKVDLVVLDLVGRVMHSCIAQGKGEVELNVASALPGLYRVIATQASNRRVYVFLKK